MQYHYKIKYVTHNTYENPVNNALWQFLIEPKNNDSQFLETSIFNDSYNTLVNKSINGYGFNTFKVTPKHQITDIIFEAEFSLIKNNIEIQSQDSKTYKKDIEELNSDPFKIEYHSFLKDTVLTTLPSDKKNIFLFDDKKTTFENLKALNKWVFIFLYYTIGATNNRTELKDLIKNNKGIAKDFAHLFCAVARQHNIPTRYVSGFLNQDQSYFGNSEIHSWVECYIPNIGWVGFDPTNNMLADFNHIKIAHGKDYNDCASLKGIIFTVGKNTTKYTVEVTCQEYIQDKLASLNHISAYKKAL